MRVLSRLSVLLVSVVCAAVVPAGAITPAEFHAMVRKTNPKYPGSGSITVREGKVVAVSMPSAYVKDLSFLRGLPLEKASVVLASNPITDLTPLKGLSIRDLTLAGCSGVKELSPLAGMKIEMLDLNGCRNVRDISALKGMPLLTAVLAGARVEDLTPLKGMKLWQLELSPEYVRKGWDVLREMDSLKVLSGDWTNTKPKQFFAKLKRGEFGTARDGGIERGRFEEEDDVESDPDDKSWYADPDETAPSPFVSDRDAWVIKETVLGPLQAGAAAGGKLTSEYRGAAAYVASADQKRYATVTASPTNPGPLGHVLVTVDGKEVGPAMAAYAMDAPQFSPDSRRYGWVGRPANGKKTDPSSIVMLDGKRVTDRRLRQAMELTFSRDGKAAWCGMTDAASGHYTLWGAWVDGTHVPTRYHGLGELTFSPDGSELAFWGRDRQRGGVYLVVNGRERERKYPDREIVAHETSPDYRNAIRFSPDGTSMAWEFRRTGGVRSQAWMYHDGERGPLFEDIGVIRFSPDGRRLGYRAVERKGMEAVVVDGKRIARGRHVSPPTFSPNAKRVAWICRGSLGMDLVVDGKPIGKFLGDDNSHSGDVGSIAFSPDSQHVVAVDVYEKLRVRYDDKLIDAQPVPAGTWRFHALCPHSLTFSPDGRHLAFGQESGYVWIDGHRLKYDRVPSGFALIWDDDTRLHFQAARDGKAVLVQISLTGQPASWSMTDPAPPVEKTPMDLPVAAGPPDAPKPPAQTADQPGPTDTRDGLAEVKADGELNLAKLYASNGLKSKAIDKLKGLIEKYPDTPAAVEAAKLLGKLRR